MTTTILADAGGVTAPWLLIADDGSELARFERITDAAAAAVDESGSRAKWAPVTAARQAQMRLAGCTEPADVED